MYGREWERLCIPICMKLNMKQRFNDLPKATLLGTGSVLEPRPPDSANLVQHSFSTYPSLLWSAVALPPAFKTHRACCQAGAGQFSNLSNPCVDRLLAVRFLAWWCTSNPASHFTVRVVGCTWALGTEGQSITTSAHGETAQSTHPNRMLFAARSLYKEDNLVN